MKKKKLLFGLIIFGLGLTGVLSILAMKTPLPPELEVALKDFTPSQKKLLILANPTIMLIIAVFVGSLLYHKVNMKVPLIEKMAGIANNNLNLLNILKFGILGGVFSGILLSLTCFIFKPILPMEFLELGDSFQPSLVARFLYGGLTEEIIMRFGLMTFLVWMASKIFGGTRPIVYWIAILIAAIIFALSHLPLVYQSIENPSMGLLTFILIGNLTGGIIFGWLYWKKGLESAFIGHLITHVIIVIAETMII